MKYGSLRNWRSLWFGIWCVLSSPVLTHAQNFAETWDGFANTVTGWVHFAPQAPLALTYDTSQPDYLIFLTNEPWARIEIRNTRTGTTAQAEAFNLVINVSGHPTGTQAGDTLEIWAGHKNYFNEAVLAGSRTVGGITPQWQKWNWIVSSNGNVVMWQTNVTDPMMPQTNLSVQMPGDGSTTISTYGAPSDVPVPPDPIILGHSQSGNVISTPLTQLTGAQTASNQSPANPPAVALDSTTSVNQQTADADVAYIQNGTDLQNADLVDVSGDVFTAANPDPTGNITITEFTPDGMTSTTVPGNTHTNTITKANPFQVVGSNNSTSQSQKTGELNFPLVQAPLAPAEPYDPLQPADPIAVDPPATGATPPPDIPVPIDPVDPPPDTTPIIVTPPSGAPEWPSDYSTVDGQQDIVDVIQNEGDRTSNWFQILMDFLAEQWSKLLELLEEIRDILLRPYEFDINDLMNQTEQWGQYAASLVQDWINGHVITWNFLTHAGTMVDLTGLKPPATIGTIPYFDIEIKTYWDDIEPMLNFIRNIIALLIGAQFIAWLYKDLYDKVAEVLRVPSQKSSTEVHATPFGIGVSFSFVVGIIAIGVVFAAVVAIPVAAMTYFESHEGMNVILSNMVSPNSSVGSGQFANAIPYLAYSVTQIFPVATLFATITMKIAAQKVIGPMAVTAMLAVRAVVF